MDGWLILVDALNTKAHQERTDCRLQTSSHCRIAATNSNEIRNDLNEWQEGIQTKEGFGAVLRAPYFRKVDQPHFECCIEPRTHSPFLTLIICEWTPTSTKITRDPDTVYSWYHVTTKTGDFIRTAVAVIHPLSPRRMLQTSEQPQPNKLAQGRGDHSGPPRKSLE